MSDLPRSYAIRTGITVQMHAPEAEDFASLRLLTFDDDGSRITYVPLTRSEVQRLSDVLSSMLPSAQRTQEADR